MLFLRLLPFSIPSALLHVTNKRPLTGWIFACCRIALVIAKRNAYETDFVLLISKVILLSLISFSNMIAHLTDDHCNFVVFFLVILLTIIIIY